MLNDVARGHFRNMYHGLCSSSSETSLLLSKSKKLMYDPLRCRKHWQTVEFSTDKLVINSLQGLIDYLTSLSI